MCIRDRPVKENCARWAAVRVPRRAEFSTEKSEIMLSNGQIQVHKQRACIAWVTGTPFVVSKCAHHSVGSSNSPTCPLQKSEFDSIGGLRGGDFQRQSLKLRYQTDRYKCASSAHALYGSQTRHPSCESVLIIPLDQAIDSPAR